MQPLSPRYRQETRGPEGDAILTKKLLTKRKLELAANHFYRTAREPLSHLQALRVGPSARCVRACYDGDQGAAAAEW